jgi:hypothetical protein
MGDKIGYSARRAVWTAKIMGTWAIVVATMSLAANLIMKL